MNVWHEQFNCDIYILFISISNKLDFGGVRVMCLLCWFI